MFATDETVGLAEWIIDVGLHMTILPAAFLKHLTNQPPPPANERVIISKLVLVYPYVRFENKYNLQG